VRAMDSLEPTSLGEVGQPVNPFISPDGKWVGFTDFSKATLRKVAMAGGKSVEICQLRSFGAVGATWMSDGTVVYGTVADGLRRVSGEGGERTVVTHPNQERAEFGHRWPEVLPGDRALLFTITGDDRQADRRQFLKQRDQMFQVGPEPIQRQHT